MATITVNYCGMEGTGETVTKAKQDAARKIEAVLFGNWDPYILFHHGMVAVVSRIPGNSARQWGYALATPEDGSRDIWQTANYETREAAIADAASHLAQNAGTYAGLEKYLSRNKQLDLDSYFVWQEAYAKAKALGYNDTECRHQADIARTGRYLS